MARIKKGDTVQVLAGRDRGKQGKVHRILPEVNRAQVEGVNQVKKHQKARPPARQGGIITMEAPIHLSNLMPVCGKCSKPTRVNFKWLEDGTKVRQCQKCGEVMD
ncbi:MAG: 50S ribosomal protein L24 [Chloroflexi bacterium]|nr:50S ribosomal protein L24 [Chloroflexota bacterium]